MFGIHLYKNREKSEYLENLIKTNEQTIDTLKWKNIANNLSLDYFRKQLENLNEN